mmetsp:Transcript_6064/g.11629  ORF Transcript_6064/g.11629 Transcript_6064/m.11629 type:complete len:248 (-) Transcript_6064:630-1373(-)
MRRFGGATSSSAARLFRIKRFLSTSMVTSRRTWGTGSNLGRAGCESGGGEVAGEGVAGMGLGIVMESEAALEVSLRVLWGNVSFGPLPWRSRVVEMAAVASRHAWQAQRPQQTHTTGIGVIAFFSAFPLNNIPFLFFSSFFPSVLSLFPSSLFSFFFFSFSTLSSPPTKPPSFVLDAIGSLLLSFSSFSPCLLGCFFSAAAGSCWCPPFVFRWSMVLYCFPPCCCSSSSCCCSSSSSCCSPSSSCSS